MQTRPRTVATAWQVACPRTERGSWSGGLYACTLRIHHEGECNRGKVLEEGVQQAPYVHTWF